MNDVNYKNIGFVVIGRNEGERLRACFESIKQYSDNCVYVDSNSTDDSLQLADNYGIKTISLDMSIPFSAARARNVGAKFLEKRHPNIEFIQFIDGDCSLAPDWISKAIPAFQSNTAIVCGRRREKYPDKSIYNQLCDIEWNTPIGEAKSCGGDFIIRAKIFHAHDGFNPSVIAGEEPEFCFRLRISGYKIYRINHDMTFHDAHIHSFAQYWKRNIRSGYAYALLLFIHKTLSEKDWLKQNLSAFFWGFCIPFLSIIGSIYNVLFLLILIIYPLNTIKIYIKAYKTQPKPVWYSFYLMIGKFPEMYGILKFIKNIIFSQKHRIIEYK